MFFARTILSFSLNWIIVLYWRTERKIVLNGITASCLECVKFYHLNDIISFSVVNHLLFCFNFLRFLFIKIQRGKFSCFSSMKLPDFSLNNLSTFGRRRTLSSKSLTCSGDLEKCVWAHSHLQVRRVTMYYVKEHSHINVWYHLLHANYIHSRALSLLKGFIDIARNITVSMYVNEFLQSMISYKILKAKISQFLGKRICFRYVQILVE